MARTAGVVLGLHEASKRDEGQDANDDERHAPAGLERDGEAADDSCQVLDDEAHEVRDGAAHERRVPGEPRRQCSRRVGVLVKPGDFHVEDGAHEEQAHALRQARSGDGKGVPLHAALTVSTRTDSTSPSADKPGGTRVHTKPVVCMCGGGRRGHAPG